MQGKVSRLFVPLVLVVAVAAAAGCRMCQAPFDYCAPTVNESGCPNCDFMARRNSAFHPTEDSTSGYVPVDTTPVTARPTAAPQPAAPAPSSSRLQSHRQAQSSTSMYR